MEVLLSNLGVVKQTEQVTTNQVLRDKIYQSIVFTNASDDSYTIDNIVKHVKMEGLPKLGLPALRSLHKVMSSRPVDAHDVNHKVRRQVQLKFLEHLIHVAHQSKTSNNKSVLQSILDGSASTSHRSGGVESGLSNLPEAPRREAILLSTEEVIQTNKAHNNFPIHRSYNRNSRTKYTDHSELSLNIYSKTGTSGSAESHYKVDESAIDALINEAKQGNKSASAVNAAVTANVPQLSAVVHTSADEPTSYSSSSSSRHASDLYTSQHPKSSVKRKSVSSSVDRGSPEESARVVKKRRAVNDKPDARNNSSSSSSSSSSSTAAQSSDNGGTVCPICSRSIEVGRRESAETVLDKHIDRCSRRRNSVVPTYSEEVDGDGDGDQFESVVDTWVDDPAGNGKAGRGSRMSLEEGEESDDDDDLLAQQHRRTRNKSRKSTSSSSSAGITRARSITDKKHSRREAELGGGDDDDNADDDEDCVVNEVDEGDDGEDDDALVENTTAYAADDWEDANYCNRLNTLSATDAETQTTPYGTAMCRKSYDRLYEYQREGVHWMFELYQEGVGGILGDEMGLGKTAQLCTHFDSLSNLQQATNRANDAKRNNSAMFLVVCPATVLQHWLSEFHAWAPSMRTVILHAISATGQELGQLGDEGIELVLRKLKTNKYTQGLAVITTYEGLRKHKAALTMIEWTAVCLDEGQKIRNPAAVITIVAKTIPAFHRIILSGTPIQNNLKELWSLFDFIYPGRLGVLPVFETEFSTPIRLGGYVNATKLEYEIAIRCAATLQRIVKPYLLRRKKEDLQTITKLPTKTEQVLFCQISPVQRGIYLNILGSSEVKAVLERRTIAFRAINTLRKLCNHPALMFHHGKVQWHSEKSAKGRKRGAAGDDDEDDDEDAQVNDDSDEDGENLTALKGSILSSPQSVSAKINWSDSGKLLVLSKVLPLWHSEGHKVLVFTQTRSMLNIIESMVQELGFKYRRLDGSTPISKRAGIIDTYNNNKSIFIMLLTTRTGGVGISLTSANRVVVFDPDWNPMTDIQSRERAWRLGQQREVTIYRLITRGTIEEKIYQRQIFKLLLSNRILDNPKQKALFSKSDIKELFQLQDGGSDGRNSSSAGPSTAGQQSRFGSSSSSLSARTSVYGEAGHDLPVGGEVNLSQAPNPNVGQPSINTQASVIMLEEGEVDDTMIKTEPLNASVDSAAPLLDVETYVHQEIPSRLLTELEKVTSRDIASSGGGGGSSSSSSSSSTDSAAYHDRDRRLLQALFEGEAITSVYDHDYSLDNSANRGGYNSKENQRNRATAAKVVDRAVHAISNSTAVYTGGSTSSSGTGTVVRPGLTSSSSTGSLNAAVSDVTIDNNSISSSSSSNRFGSRSASGNTALSSAALLSNIRANQNVDTLGSGGSEKKNVRAGVRFAEQPASAADSSATSSGRQLSTFASPSVASPRVSVQQDIMNRLSVLFKDSAGAPVETGASTAVTRYTTQGILLRFRDLGDQYAPLFKECLRSVAVLKDGFWVKK